MLWNELDYEMQMKILDRIGDLLLQEKDEAMQFGIAAAITELEVWSNSPIREVPNLTELSKETPVEPRPVPPEFIEALRDAGMHEEVCSQLEREHMVAQANDAIACCRCWLPWLCGCHCHKKES
jgi:hypothetical protein